MTTIDRKSRCSGEEMSCNDVESSAKAEAPDPRARKSTAASPPVLPEQYGRQASALATATKAAPPPPLSPADCAKLPGAVLDHQASALRSRLSKPVDYAERPRDAAELHNVESELRGREATKQTAARDAHGGVMLCKRVADLPGKDIHGAEHWWLQTTRKSAGMGPANGNVPGHGESLPEDFDTKIIDHSKEVATSCARVTKPVDEDCVDRELQIGESTGTWIPGVNDCHTVLEKVIDKCHDEAVAKALDDVAASRPGNAAVGAR